MVVDLTNLTLTLALVQALALALALALSKLYEEKRDYLLIMYMLNYVFLLVEFISCHILLARSLSFVLLPE